MANMRMGMAPANGIGDPEKRKKRLERRQERQTGKVQEANARMAARSAEKRMKSGKGVPEQCTKDGGCSAYDTQMNAKSEPTLLKDTKLVKGVKKAAKAVGEVFERNAPKLRRATPGGRRRYAKRAHRYAESLKKRENRQNQREASRTARQETRAESKDKRIVARGERKIARIQNKVEKVNTRTNRKEQRKAQRVERRASGGGIMSIFKKKGPKKLKGTF